MANELTKTDIIGIALEHGAQGTIEFSDIDNDNSPEATKAKRLYKKVFQTLMSSFPWPFATDRVELQRSAGNERPVRSYTYFYDPPPSPWFLWDLYRNKDQGYSYGSIWNYQYYQVFSFDEGGDAAFFSGEAEIIGGRIASNHSRLYAFYTPKQTMPPDKWSVHFTDCFIATLGKEFVRRSTTDVEMLATKIKLSNSEMNTAKTMATLENKGAVRIERPEILQKLDIFTGGY